VTDTPKSTIRETDADAIQLAKTLLRTPRSGALASLDPQTGAPIATRVGTATDFAGRPVLLISGLTAHFKALENDPRCSLLLGEPGKGDPLAHPRLTVSALACFVERDSDEHKALAWRYINHQPKAKLYVDLGDFRFVILDPQSASLNGGFGKAYVLTADDLLSSEDTDLKKAEFGALEHMNDDHADSIAQYARHYCGAGIGNWLIAGLDADGITISLGDDIRRIYFDSPATVPQDFHIKLVGMAKTARKALGEL
jgi:putative heme iron utilization protein